MEAIQKRKQELERQSCVSAIESASIALEIGTSKTFMIKDFQTYQRLKTRFNRLKSESGWAYKTTLDGNNVIVTRTA